MSIASCAWAMEQSPRTAQHKLVLLLLADEADPEGYVAFPDLRDLARIAILHVDDVNEIIGDLLTDELVFPDVAVGYRIGQRS